MLTTSKVCIAATVILSTTAIGWAADNNFKTDKVAEVTALPTVDIGPL